MKRLCAAMLFVVALAGCANRKPLAPDPFFGRTAITPPGTGSVRPAGDPGYSTASGRLSSVSAPAAAHVGSGATVIPDPADAWTRKDAPRNLASTNTGTSGGSANSTSYAMNSGGAATSRRTDWSWFGSSSGSGSIRTRVSPPDYGRAANVGTNQPAPVDSMADRRSSGLSAATGERQMVGVMQPGAAATVRHTPQDQPAARRHDGSLAPATSATAAVSTGEWSRVGESSASRTVPVATAGNASSVTSSSAAARVPSRSVAPGQPIDIMDLPDPGARASTGGRVDANIRLASFNTPSQRSVTAAPQAEGRVLTTNSPPYSAGGQSTAFSPSARYGYDPGYSRLRGRLEYSAAAKRWRLRYIPVNAKADPYGGSVVLRDTTLLVGCRHGEFLEVQGRLSTGESGDWGYAPVYEIAQLRPIGR